MSVDFIHGLTYADRLRISCQSRQQAIQASLGCELIELTSLMGPISEGPEWPACPAWLAARNGKTAYIISDGLSDPWVERDKPETGLGVEVFIASDDSGLSAHSPLTNLADSWLFPTMAEISHTIAGLPNLAKRLHEGELSSMELNIEHIKDGRGRIGVLLNLFSHCLSLPAGEVRLLSATLLTASELRYLRGKGNEGRQTLALGLMNSSGYLSQLQRPSLF